MLLVGVPVALVPILVPRKALAKKLTERPAREGSRDRRSMPSDHTIQALVDEFRGQLGVTSLVLVSVVPENKWLVSVERSRDQAGAFTLTLDAGFLQALSDDERRAVVAHELGHVWIFTHHPFLQTEELANQIALRLVSREVLEEVYEKVWQRTGTRGALRYLPAN